MGLPITPDTLWRQYEQHIDLYKFYIEATLKINAFHYAMAGALLSFYFTHSEIGLAKWALALPFAMSLGIGGLFAYGSSILEVTRTDIINIGAALGLQVFPEVRVLTFLLMLSAAFQAMTAFGLLLLMGGC